MQVKLTERVRFGEFQFDLKAGELRQGDYRVVLQEQPFQILRMLVERRGQVVTRDEIKKQLWPNDTIVEFDHSIQTAISKLRQALGDSADHPRYIETVARRGYRLISKVESAGDSSSDGFPVRGGSNVGPAPDVALQTYVVATSNLIGKKVSHYRVLEVVGGGGMGVVYKAEDLKLGRRVAMKFLPEELGSDPRALERFEREARAASALDHSNICAIHEFGEHDGQPFIVMPLLQGQNLRDLIGARSTPFSAEEILNFGIQIASGLEAAHDKGIIHRDIKPANIFISGRGEAKILDFGLAKLTAAATGEAEIGVAAGTSETPRSLGLTRTGVALGTAPYMSPEQVRGEPLDVRTDIFSFGLVLYEMATGQCAFTGQTAAVVQDAILNNSAIPIGDLNSLVPTRLVAAIDKALQKDRKERYQSAADMGSDLRTARQENQHPGTSFVPEAPKSRLPRWLAAFGIIALIVGSAGPFLLRHKWLRPEPATEPQVRQLTSLGTAVLESIALSPEGKRLAYRDLTKGLSLLHIDTGETRTFPDGVSLTPMTWLPDGDHLFCLRDNQQGTWKMSVVDGTVRKFNEKIVSPIASPDGKQLAFAEENDIWLSDADGKSVHKILSVNTPWILDSLAWSPASTRIGYVKHSISANEQTAHVAAISGGIAVELESCSLDGQCSTILSEPRLHLDSKYSDLIWLPDGRIVFAQRELPPNEHGSSNLWSLEVDPNSGRPRGEPKRLTNWLGFTQISLTASADGKRLAFQRVRNEDTVRIAPLRAQGRELGPSRPLDSSTWSSRTGGWTPDSRVLFTAVSHGGEGIFWQRPTDGDPHPLVTGPAIYSGPVVTPDDQWLLYTEYLKDGSARLMRMPLAGGAVTTVLLGDYGYHCAKGPSRLCVLSELKGNLLGFSILDPFRGRGRELTNLELKVGSPGYAWRLSPDGKMIALVDNGGSGDQVWMLSTEGGATRALRVKGWNLLQRVNWSADGSHLYLSGRREVLALGRWSILETDLAGRVKVLTDVSMAEGWLADPIPSPDGRYLIYTEKAWPSSVTLLENF